MRVSVWPCDPGYAHFAEWRACKVLLDGQEIALVFTADTDRGEVIRAKTDDRGRLVIDGDEVVTETLHGNVELIRP